MNLEPRNKLKRDNSDDLEDGEILNSKKQCSLSKISTSENTDSTSRALSIPEVLTCIVKHLPADDSKNFRCVCKLWNEYFIPKFVFRAYIPYHETAALLRNSSCRRIKVEFQNYLAGHIPDDIWEEKGCNIRSLHFHCCDISMNTLQTITSHCIALEELEICQKYYLFDRSELSVVRLLDYFIERKERRTRLRTLAIEDFNSIKISEFLEKTFTVFPYIVDLRCRFDGIYDDDEASCLASNRTYNLRKLDSYTVFSKRDYLWSKNSVLPMLDYQLFRLKKFKTLLYVEDFFADLTKKERLFLFFTIQKDLEVIDLEITRSYLKDIKVSNDDVKALIKSLVFHILKSCLKLREFELIGQYGTIKLANEEYEEFFSLISDLRSLKLSYYFEKDTSTKTVLPSSLPTLPLRIMRMNSKEPCFFSLIKLCTQLKHLYTDVYSDEQLSELIAALPNLETLVLRLHNSVTNYGFIGENEEFSIRRLQNLEYLVIMDYPGKISKEIFDQFCFPRLKYLQLELRSQEDLPETLSDMPALETLQIRLTHENFHWCTEVVIKLCISLTNLKHLIIHELVDQNQSLVVEIFNSLSNLKLISCCRDNITFIFNRTSGEACCSLTHKLEFFENEFFGRIKRY